jgi:Flp pilus assembly protein TadD
MVVLTDCHTIEAAMSSSLQIARKAMLLNPAIGEWEPAALASFQKVLRVKPRNVKAEDNLGLTFEMLGDTEKARAAFLSANQMENDRPSGYSLPFLNMGRSWSVRVM